MVDRKTTAAHTPPFAKDGIRPSEDVRPTGPAANLDEAHLRRVVIENVEPEVDAGRFPAKRVAGEKVVVEADVYGDGHDAVTAFLLYRIEDDRRWTEVPMQPLGNDRWRAEFEVTRLRPYRYTVAGWVDPFKSWHADMLKRIAAGQDVGVDLRIGAALIKGAAGRASGDDAERLHSIAAEVAGDGPQKGRAALATSDDTAALAAKYADRRAATFYRELAVQVDPPRAAFSAWYEMFPRSCSPEPGHHGTFADCEAWLPYIAEMGFDVVYFPPIHPVGRNFRKGKNNAVRCKAGDPGSPWAIGSEEGGHKAVHPDLGTLEDFRRFVAKAKEHAIDVALDIAFQCAPDHPYVREHPEWFRWRPDGTVQYAENPPKKYQDIYPLEFETPDWRALWEELKSVVEFWAEQGVRIFRVDNPHTKPFAFWEWLIGEVKRKYPEAIFLSEAFTRPKIMYRLAKLGFTQSYTYFAWRNDKWGLTEYLTELTQSRVREFFRPSFWPNTPDILNEHLQRGGRPAFMARVVLAATLAPNYGIYGPAFELCENVPREPGSEEYLNSEKYEIKHWDINRQDSLRGLIARLNSARRENPALQSLRGLRFHPVENDQLICYSRETEDRDNVLVVVVNLDSASTQSGWVDLPIWDWGIGPAEPFTVHDLLDGSRYTWRGGSNFVMLDPHKMPAHLLVVERNRGRRSA